jgi:Ca2+-binding RTX toxin-like protein
MESSMATIVGDEDDNFLSGTAGSDSIFGEGGDDFIAGNGGDDLLEGGSGRDQLHGGDGIDTVSYLGLEGGVHVDLGTGDGYTGEAAGDFIFEVENILGTDQRLRGHPGGLRHEQQPLWRGRRR